MTVCGCYDSSRTAQVHQMATTWLYASCITETKEAAQLTGMPTVAALIVRAAAYSAGKSMSHACWNTTPTGCELAVCKLNPQPKTQLAATPLSSACASASRTGSATPSASITPSSAARAMRPGGCTPAASAENRAFSSAGRDSSSRASATSMYGTAGKLASSAAASSYSHSCRKLSPSCRRSLLCGVQERHAHLCMLYKLTNGHLYQPHI